MKKLFLVLLFIVSNCLYGLEKTIAAVEIKEAITPVTERFMKRTLKTAELKKYDAVLFTLDTPGGLLESTRNIVQELLNTKLDSIVYVSPKGSRAGSAGVFITLSAKYAAMAPGCNIGAAHPVSMEGIGGSQGDNENTKTLSKKIENDTVAFIESIAKLRNRNTEWAVKSVKESVSITSDEALSNHVINYIARDKTDLAEQIYGTENTYKFIEIKKSWAEDLLSVLANPNLVYFILILGFYGILYEIIHPGTIFSGALGALFLIIALYSMQTLPFNYAGLFLIALAFILFILEIFITSHGLMTIGGMICLIVGSAMLFDSPLPFLRLHVSSVLTVALTTLAVVGGLVYIVGKTIRRKAVSGRENLIGSTGIAIDDFKNGRGQIKIHGEIWNASAERSIKKEEAVTVKQIKGLNLIV